MAHPTIIASAAVLVIFNTLSSQASGARRTPRRRSRNDAGHRQARGMVAIALCDDAVLKGQSVSTASKLADGKTSRGSLRDVEPVAVALGRHGHEVRRALVH